MTVDMWKNLQRIFVFIRFDIKDKKNSHVIDIVTKVIDNDMTNDEMCKMIVCLMPKWKGQLILKECDMQEIMLNRQLKEFIIRALEFMKEHLLYQNYETAYDIADMLHVLPEIVVDNKKKELKLYWKDYVKPFQKKWKCKVFNEWKNFSI